MKDKWFQNILVRGFDPEHYDFTDFNTSSMKHYSIFVILFVLSVKVVSQPVSVLSENKHYFLLKGKPTVLITSAEHYGAIVNKRFDYNQ